MSSRIATVTPDSPSEAGNRPASESVMLARIRIIGSVERSRPIYKSYVRGRIGDCEVPLFVDSGNTFRSCINQRMFDALGLTENDLRPLAERATIGTAKKNSKLTIKGETKEESAREFVRHTR